MLSLFFTSISLSHTHTHTHTPPFRATGEGSCSGPSINTALVSSLQGGWQVSPRVFLPHRSDPPYAHPNHGYTAASLSLSHTPIYACVYGCTSTRAHTKTSSVSSIMCSFIQAAPCFCLLSASAQLNLQNLIFCVLRSSLPPPPPSSLLHPFNAVFFARSLLQRERQLTESEEEKTSFPPRETPVKNTHPAEITC